MLKQIELPRTVIVIGPKHTANGLDWAIAPNRVWSFPGGQLESDLELARALVAAIPGLQFDAAAHQQEHGIEVELPIIHRLAPQTKIVGICVSGATLARCEDFTRGLASVLENFILDPPLLLISSDMNHYADDAETRRLDVLALAEFDRLDEDALFETCHSNHISMCGLVPAVIVLKTLKKLGRLNQSIEVGYATSAEASGDTSRCVGYAGSQRGLSFLCELSDVGFTILVAGRNDLDQRDHTMPADMSNRDRAAKLSISRTSAGDHLVSHSRRRDEHCDTTIVGLIADILFANVQRQHVRDGSASVLLGHCVVAARQHAAVQPLVDLVNPAVMKVVKRPGIDLPPIVSRHDLISERLKPTADQRNRRSGMCRRLPRRRSHSRFRWIGSNGRASSASSARSRRGRGRTC